jgi:hypothetical protein
MNNFNDKIYNTQNNVDPSLYNNNNLTMLKNMSHENFINVANSIDNITLNGTNINDLNQYKQPELQIPSNMNNYEDNKTLIKSITKEIIKNLKDDDSEFFETISNNKKSNSINNNVKKNISKNIGKNIGKNIETMTSEHVQSSSNYVNWFFDECFNLKDFILLFTIYFLLSQEMIKDVFAKYFTSLNPNNEGVIDIKGVIIYGLILTVLFMIIRKFV